MKRPVLYCTISFCLGISLSYFFNTPVTACIILSIASIIFSALFLKKNVLSHVFLYIALVAFGAAFYGNCENLPDNHISKFATQEGADVSIKGAVIDEPVTKKAIYGGERTDFTMKSELLSDDGRPCAVTGLVRVSLYTDKDKAGIDFADTIMAKGILLKPEGLNNPGIFDYSRYLKIKNIYAVLRINGTDGINVIKKGPANFLLKNAYIARQKIRSAITSYVDGQYQGFIKAILIGDRNDLDSSITDDFVKTGTVHVIAISGLNIVLVAGIFLLIFRWIGLRKKSSLVLASIAIAFYCFVAGSSPPVVRATAVFVISCLAYLIDRESDILNSLSIAAFIILLANPKELFDPSFQLSFASVIAIVLFSPRIEEVIKFRPEYVSKSMSVSIAATIGVFPIVAKYFNILSPIAIAANLVIVPALFIITVVSFALLFLNFLGVHFCLSLLGALVSLLTRVTFYINHLFAGIFFSHLRIPAPSILFLIAYYCALFWLFFLPRKRYLVIALLLAANIVVWAKFFSPDNKLLKVTFLDVGKGDSSLIQFPKKGAILIDGGPGGMESIADMGRSVVGPYLWNNGIRKLDAVIVTHFHEDHLGGLLYILKNFDVRCVIDNGASPTETIGLYNEYRNIMRTRHTRHITVGDGDEVLGAGNVKIFILNPAKNEEIQDSNDNSIVCKVVLGNSSILFCGDISSKAMSRIMPYGEFLQSDVVKIPHHGGSMGEESVAKEFFEKLSPRIFVISTNYRYSLLPVAKRSKELLESLESDISHTPDFILREIPRANRMRNFRSGERREIYETCKDGAIKAETDGSRFYIEAFARKN